MPILINDNTARVQYTATSGQTVFAVPFEFFENGDLKVYRNSTLQTITTHYTLTGAGVTGGGNLTFVSGVTLNDIITIVRDIPIKRVTDFPLSGPFNIAALNLQLDQLTAMVQEVNTLVTTRVPLLAEFDQPSAFSALPTQANRANNYFVFDSNGNPAVASSALAVTDFTQAGTGAVLRTAQAKMRDIVSRSDYDTLANAWASTGRKPFIDPTTGRMLITVTDTPLNYSTSRAGFVYQGLDSANMAVDELIPNVAFDINYTGQGWVDAANYLSRSIGMGLFTYVGKQGDGSAHAFTVIGELKAIGTGAVGTGTGGYNECGGYQGTITNVGSTRGNISGYEFITKDGSAGTNFDTAMKNCIARVARFNGGTRPVHCFMASSEGNQPVDSILTVNTNAYNQFKTGIDFSNTVFTAGFAALFPNNTGLSFKGGDGTNRIVLGSSAIGISYMRPSDTSAWVEMQSSAGTTLLRAENVSDSISIYVNGSLKKVTQGAVDSGGVGFRLLRVPN